MARTSSSTLTRLPRAVPPMVVVDACRHGRQLEGLDGERTVVTAGKIQELSLMRARAAGPGAAGPAGSSKQHYPRQPLSGSTGTAGDIGFAYLYPPLDLVPAPGHLGHPGHDGRRSSLEEADARHSLRPLQPPAPPHHHQHHHHQQLQQLQQQQQHLPGKSTSLVHLAKATAGMADTAATHVAAMSPLSRRPSEGLPMIPSSSPSPSPVGGVAPASRYAVGVGGGYRCSTPPSWATSPLLSGDDGAGGERYRGAAADTGKGATLSPPTQEKDSAWVDAPFPSFSARDHHPHWHQSHLPTPSAAEAAVGMTSLGPPPSWDLGYGGPSGVAPRSNHQGGGLRQGVGDLSGGTGAFTLLDYDRELHHDDRLQRGSPLLPDHYHPQPSRPPQGLQRQGHYSPMRGVSPPADTYIITPPGPGRGGSDPGSHGTDLRSLASGISDLSRSLPLPDMAGANAAVGGDQQAPGGGAPRKSFTFVELYGRSDRYAVDRGGLSAGADDAAGTELVNGVRRSRSDPRPTRLSRAKRCMQDGCDRRPRYGYKDQDSKIPAYCAKHRAVGMVDTRHPLCKEEQCTRQPSFGMEGDRRASYCARHREEGMVNVTSRRCLQFGCIRHPNFGFPGDKRASYCREHRETGMIDVVSRRCQDPSCMRRPLYNTEGMRPVWCSRHKLPGMIDVVSARCEEPGCMCHPSFGYASDKKALRCSSHRLEDMEGVKGRRQKRPREVPDAATSASDSADATTASTTPCSASSPSTSPAPPAALRPFRSPCW